VLGSGVTDKERGGNAFKRGEYARAEKHYTAALAAEVDQRSEAASVLLSNRSACFAKLNQAKCVCRAPIRAHPLQGLHGVQQVGAARAAAAGEAPAGARHSQQGACLLADPERV